MFEKTRFYIFTECFFKTILKLSQTTPHHPETVPKHIPTYPRNHEQITLTWQHVTLNTRFHRGTIFLENPVRKPMSSKHILKTHIFINIMSKETTCSVNQCSGNPFSHNQNSYWVAWKWTIENGPLVNEISDSTVKFEIPRWIFKFHGGKSYATLGK